MSVEQDGGLAAIAVFETGGTINGILEPSSPAPERSRVLDYLRERAGLLGIAIRSERTICLKDSRAITDVDRDRLTEAIRSSSATHILVPHGTFTMSETGSYLKQHLGGRLRTRTVVLVGSKIPLGEPHSDAPGNLAFALQCLREQPPGVWVAMSRRAWDPDGVKKDPETEEFVEHREL